MQTVKVGPEGMVMFYGVDRGTELVVEAANKGGCKPQWRSNTQIMIEAAMQMLARDKPVETVMDTLECTEPVVRIVWCYYRDPILKIRGIYEQYSRMVDEYVIRSAKTYDPTQHEGYKASVIALARYAPYLQPGLSQGNRWC